MRRSPRQRWNDLEAAEWRSERWRPALHPAYNEVTNLERAVSDVISAVRDFDDYEVLIVDDDSTDGTDQVADRLASENRRVTAIHHPRNFGLATAYQTALRRARMQYFGWVGGDGEIETESVRVITEAVGSADLVIPYHATPWKREGHRRAITWFATTQINVLFGWCLRYYQGPTVYPTELARTLPAKELGFFFASELLAHALVAGHSWVEVGIRHRPRTSGTSRAVRWSNIVQAQLAVFRLWWALRIKRNETIPRAAGDARASIVEAVD